MFGGGALGGEPPAESAVDPEREQAARGETRNAIILSSGFMAVFLGFSVCQNTATTQDRTVGSTALGIVYIVFTLANLVSASVVIRLGVKRSLLIASVFYALFCLSNVWFTPYVIYPAAGLVGFSAALLWTAQGGVITRCACEYEYLMRLPRNSTIGYFQGLFFSVYQASSFVGNMIAFILLFNKEPRMVIYLTMTGATLLGFILLCFLKLAERAQLTGYLGDSFLLPGRLGSWDDSVFSVSEIEGWSRSSRASSINSFINITWKEELPTETKPRSLLGTPPATATPPDGKRMVMPVGDGKVPPPSLGGGGTRERGVPGEGTVQQQGGRGNTSEHQRSTFGLLKSNRDLQVMMFAAFYNGASLAFVVGEYPLLVGDKSIRYLGLSIYGLCNMVASQLFGWLSDKMPREALIVFGSTLHLGIFAILLSPLRDRTPDILLLLVAGVYGVGDAVLNTQTYANISLIFSDNCEPAFASFKMFQALAASVAFFLHVYTPWTAKIVILASLLVIATIILVVQARALRLLKSSSGYRQLPPGFTVTPIPNFGSASPNRAQRLSGGLDTGWGPVPGIAAAGVGDVQSPPGRPR